MGPPRRRGAHLRVLEGVVQGAERLERRLRPRGHVEQRLHFKQTRSGAAHHLAAAAAVEARLLDRRHEASDGLAGGVGQLTPLAAKAARRESEQHLGDHVGGAVARLEIGRERLRVEARKQLVEDIGLVERREARGRLREGEREASSQSGGNRHLASAFGIGIWHRHLASAIGIRHSAQAVTCAASSLIETSQCLNLTDERCSRRGRR